VALLLATLGVVPSHSQPHVSNDNPFSEAQFKTLSTGLIFRTASAPTRTPRPSANGSSPGHDIEHRHGALGLMTPHAAQELGTQIAIYYELGSSTCTHTRT
jgi:putative transposase